MSRFLYFLSIPPHHNPGASCSRRDLVLSFAKTNNEFRGSEKGPSRMRISLVAAVAAVILPVIASLPGQSDEGRGYKSFQLVYHSDTRGYYRPCG